LSIFLLIKLWDEVVVLVVVQLLRINATIGTAAAGTQYLSAKDVVSGGRPCLDIYSRSIAGNAKHLAQTLAFISPLPLTAPSAQRKALMC
jgi:hypothetical protein